MSDDNIRSISMEEGGLGMGEGAAWLLQTESIVSFPNSIHCPSRMHRSHYAKATSLATVYVEIYCRYQLQTVKYQG